MPLTNGTPESIEVAYINMFRKGFTQAFQQFDSRMLPFVEIERQQSEFDFYNRIGIAEEMSEDTERYGDNPMSEIEIDRRRIVLRDYELGKAIDEKDLIRVAENPMNEYSVAMRASGYRKMDDVIYDGLFGKAYTGKKGDTTIDWVGASADAVDADGLGAISVGEYSSGHSNPVTTAGNFQLITGDFEGIHIGANYNGTDVHADPLGLTLPKLKGVRQTMLRLDAITQDEILDCHLTSQQFNDLLSIDEVINSDYSVRKNLAEGNVTTFLGFRFIHSERLPKNAAGQRRVVVTRPRSLKLAIGKDLTADMWRLTGKKKIPYIYFKMSIGSSRMWGECTAEISCAE